MKLVNRLTPAGVVGITLMLGVIIIAIFAPWISPYDPLDGDTSLRLMPPMSRDSEGHIFILGTDQLGRDILSRIFYGARISLLIGFTAVPVSALIGSSIGIVAGYYRGFVDEVFMRLADIQLAIPYILLLLSIITIIGPSFINLVLVLGIGRWMPYAKLVRGETLAVRSREYVQAAESMGASKIRIMFRHILPNVSATIIVWSTILLPQLILAEASISFLGLGIQPPTPTWGGMISQGREYVWQAWWLSVFPGVAISLTSLGGNLLGDWLRDVLDPRLTDQ